MFKLIAKIFGFVILSVLVVFMISTIELLISGGSNVLLSKIMHYELSSPPISIKLVLGGFVGALLAPVIEEYSKSLFLKKGRTTKWAYSYALIFALLEGISYIPLIMANLGLSLIWAVLMRIPPVLMHVGTVHFQVNGTSKSHGLVRGIVAHSSFNILSGLMFFWTI